MILDSTSTAGELIQDPLSFISLIGVMEGGP